MDLLSSSALQNRQVLCLLIPFCWRALKELMKVYLILQNSSENLVGCLAHIPSAIPSF